jgi:hypothetical protein
MKKALMTTCVLLLSLVAQGCAARKTEDASLKSKDSPAAHGVMTAGLRAEDAARPVRISLEGTDAAEPSVATGAGGAVYVAWVEHRAGKEADVWFSKFDESGAKQGQPLRVNPSAGFATAWHGDPPTIGVAADGVVYVGWTARAKQGKHATDLYVSASRDGGQSFEAPVKVNDDQKPTDHGMHSLAVTPEGRVYVAWLDERNVAPPPPTKPGAGHKHAESNRELFFAYSADGGRTFSSNRRVSGEVCPCCKTSLAVAPDGRVYVSWRQVLPGEFRHIAVASSGDGGETFSTPVVVSDDRWMIKGCPVSGAALQAGAGGTLRVLWYTAGEAGRAGLYWSESRDGGQTFAPRRAFEESGGHGTPVLLGGSEGDLIAVWEGRGDGIKGQPLAASLSGEGGEGGGSLAVAETGELPVAARTAAQVFVAYVLKKDDGRGVWLARLKPSARS